MEVRNVEAKRYQTSTAAKRILKIAKGNARHKNDYHPERRDLVRESGPSVGVEGSLVSPRLFKAWDFLFPA
jgi:hypothetical protein